MALQRYPNLIAIYIGSRNRIILINEARLTSKLWTGIFTNNEDVIVLGEL